MKIFNNYPLMKPIGSNICSCVIFVDANYSLRNKKQHVYLNFTITSLTLQVSMSVRLFQ